jgi:hypothetical protein
MKQRKCLGVLALPLATGLLLIGGMVGCTCMPAASPPSSTELPADTAAPSSPTALPTDTAMPTLTEDTGPWEVVLQIKVQEGTRMAAFLDDKTGFMAGAGAPGRVNYTTDGGQTWTLAESSVG